MNENRVRKVAYAIYQRAKEDGLEDKPADNWKAAEAIACNPFRYALWIAWYWLKREHYPVLVLVAMASLVASAGMMTWNVQTNAASTDLNTRPYVSINMEHPRHFVSGQDAFYGNNIILKNTGRIPAARVSTRYYITTELDRENMNGEQWFNDVLGGFGGVSFIAPQASEVEPGFRSLGPSAEYYYWEAVVTYEGLSSDRAYWTHIKKVYLFNRPANQFIPVSTYGEWDRNTNFAPPQVSTREEVVASLDEIIRRRRRTNQP